MSKNNNEKDKILKEDKEFIISHARNLEKRLRNLETEKQLLDAERLRLEQELHSLRNEIDRLREPPLEAAIIIGSTDQGRSVVMSTRGPIFVVNASRKVMAENLEPGTFVALNNRTYAIMEIISLDLEYIEKANQIIYRGIHKELYEILTKK